MRGLVGRVKDAAAAKVAASVAASRPRADGASLATTVGCGEQGRLGRALRRVTHSDCAAVPPEDLREVVLLAGEGEEPLALVLRHIEENLRAPPSQWRRIHGALALLDRMIRACPAAPSGGSLVSTCAEDALVGRAWYEARVLERLRVLSHFEHSEDARVSLLVRRAAASAQEAAERHLLDRDDEAASSRSGGDGGAAGGGGEPSEGGAPGRAGGRFGTPPRVEPRLLGRPLPPTSAAQAASAARRLESASSALDALGDVGTKRAQPPPRPKAPQAGQALPEEPPAAGLCGCCRRRRRPGPTGHAASPGSVSSPPRAGGVRDDISSASESAYDESGALLV